MGEEKEKELQELVKRGNFKEAIERFNLTLVHYKEDLYSNKKPVHWGAGIISTSELKKLKINCMVDKDTLALWTNQDGAFIMAWVES